MEIFLGFVFICLVIGAIVIYNRDKSKDNDGFIPQKCLHFHSPSEPKVDGCISEPVISIVESFKEKGRWKIKEEFNLLSPGLRCDCRFKAKDTATGEVYSFYSSDFYYLTIAGPTIIIPNRVRDYSLPTWMTDEEKKYVVSSIQGYMDKINERFMRIRDKESLASEARCKVNQDKERERLKTLYCK